MPAGRPPKPTKLHELHGTINTTRHAARALEPVPPGDDLVDPPDWFSDSQKEGWAYAIKHAPLGLLKPIDLTMLVIWVEAEDRHRRAAMAQAILDQRNPRMPMLLPRKRPGKRPGDDIIEFVESPYVRILQRAAETLLRAVTELGFSPASRPRLAAGLSAPAAKQNSPWTKLKVLQGGAA